MTEFQPRGRSDTIRVDLLVIADLIESGARVLDIGCGDGALLHYLAHNKDVDGRGIEISQAGVNACVRQGLSVVQGDADTDLRDYPDKAFDYVVLSQTLQATHSPREVLAELVRIGRHAIVSFPNFAYWRIRWQLLASGRMPETEALAAPWYETPNIHFCTIRDFVILCRDMGLRIEQRSFLTHEGKTGRFRSTGLWANFLGEQGLFVLRGP